MAEDDVEDPVSRCPIACDAVIPIVYPNQPIAVPYKSIRGEMNILQRAAIDEVESVRRTFTRPNASPPLSIHSADADKVRVLGLGHAGVAFYNGETGQVAYYEYGRYGGDFGAVRPVSMPNLSFDEDDNPESGPFQALLSSLTKTNGGPYGFEAVFVKLPMGSYHVMKTFAEERMEAVRAQTAAEYDVKSNHCFTFALEVAASAGVSANVSAAEDLEMILVSAIGTRVDPPEGNAIELPSRQMRYLQTRYTALDVTSGGAISGEFAFPPGPYAT